MMQKGEKFLQSWRKSKTSIWPWAIIAGSNQENRI